MINWKTYSQFSEDYLNAHREILLVDILHQTIAYILHPCISENEELRDKITLSLNLSYLQQLECECHNADVIKAAKSILQIPNDSYFRQNWNQSYPLLLLEKEWSEKEVKRHFQIVDRLVWSLLRLGVTYQSCIGERRASLNEVIEIIVGNTPLKVQQDPNYLCGEKAYASHFKHYKSVCHFIAAFEYMKSEDSQLSSLLHLSDRTLIERFLNLSEIFRQELSRLRTPNVRNKELFGDKFLISLPSYIQPDQATISIHPLPEKISELNHKLESA